jgi:hypothetical protein
MTHLRIKFVELQPLQLLQQEDRNVLLVPQEKVEKERKV